MTKKLDHRFWAKYFKVYDVLNMVIPYQELLDNIVKEAEIKKNDFVLDAGCGTGNLSMKCKSAGAKVFGIDYCIEALDRYRQKDLSAEMLVHDLTKPLPFPDIYFDVVVCNNVLYALDKSLRPQIIKEFLRVLKPGGKIVLSNVHKNFKSMMIYSEHIKESIKKFGRLRTLFDIFRMAVPTIKMFYYNERIKNENKAGSYSFVRISEQASLLKDAGMISVSDNIIAYGGQAIINHGKKK